ncbi:Mbeg1-like protein [Paenibacillus sp. FSL F4-0125]|uniref:Mbeg1-like protein n=1 Tax=Paenibacillus sp. FSL F4-0125 TaxID=2954730 RepID=UPI0030FCDFEC
MADPDILSEIELKQISQIVYLDILDNKDLGKIYTRKNDKITLGEVLGFYSTPEGQRQLKERFPNDLNGVKEYDQWIVLIEQMNKPPYKNWEISNIVSHNKKEESGFVAFTVDTLNGEKVAAFRGSEPMENPLYRNDWKNNGTTAYSIEAMQQTEAREYMKSFKTDGSYDLYLTGHSLGGNLALYSSFILSEDLRKHLISASTFNAPGFNGDVLDKFKSNIDEMNEKGQIKEFRNKYDIVPALFLNPSAGIYIDTESERDDVLAHHSLFSLKTNGNNTFLLSDSQTRGLVPNLVHNITVGLEVIPDFLKESLVEGVFKVLDGEVDLRPLAIAGITVVGVLLATVGPVAVVTAAITTALAVLVGTIKALIALYIIGFVIDSVIPWIKQKVEDIKERVVSFYNQSVEFVTNMVTEAVRVTNLIGERIAEFSQKVKQAVSDVMTKMKDGFNRFVDNTIQYVKAQKEYWIGVKDKAMKKMGDIFQSVKAKIKKTKDEFIAGARAIKDSAISKVKSTITKTITKIAVASASVIQGAKILANMDKLESLQKSLVRKEESIAEIVERILSIASGVSSNVGRAYSESYVQAQLRELQRISNEVRTQKNRVTTAIHSKTAGLKYTITKYRDIESKIVAAARASTTTMRLN